MSFRDLERDLLQDKAKRGKSKRPDNVVELWEGELTKGERGTYAKTLRNVALILANANEFRGVIAFDDFAHRLTATRQSPAGEVGPWTDDHDLRATVWLQGSRWKLEAGDDLVSRAVRAVAARQRVHPLRARLDSLKWDGVKRVETWLTTYLGAEDTKVHRVIGKTWLIGAVARAYVPGEKVDAALILEGEQGKGKSTALKILSLGFFSDELADIGNKDAAMQLQGAWIHELAELDALSKAEITKAKAFLTRAVDRFRPPWGRHVVEIPRQCVFAGTTNHDDYIKDETGGRRFLPVKVQRIDLAALRRDVEQLWAEAIALYRAGELSYVDDEDVLCILRAHTATRYQADAWEKTIADFAQVRESVSVAECLGHIGIDRGRWSQPDQNRVARCLKSLGFQRRQTGTGRSREWRYFQQSHHMNTSEKQALVNASQSEKQAQFTTDTTITTLNNNSKETGRAGGHQDHQVQGGALVSTGNDAPSPYQADWWEADQ